MAVHKAIRSNPVLQPKDPQPKDPQLKSELFEALRHLNRGFGVALSSFDVLQRKERYHHADIFPRDLLLSYRNQTEELRAVVNRELLRLMAGNEEKDAKRFGVRGGRKRARRS